MASPIVTTPKADTTAKDLISAVADFFPHGIAVECVRLTDPISKLGGYEGCPDEIWQTMLPHIQKQSAGSLIRRQFEIAKQGKFLNVGDLVRNTHRAAVQEAKKYMKDCNQFLEQPNNCDFLPSDFTRLEHKIGERKDIALFKVFKEMVYQEYEDDDPRSILLSKMPKFLDLPPRVAAQKIRSWLDTNPSHLSKVTLLEQPFPEVIKFPNLEPRVILNLFVQAVADGQYETVENMLNWSVFQQLIKEKSERVRIISAALATASSVGHAAIVEMFTQRPDGTSYFDEIGLHDFIIAFIQAINSKRDSVVLLLTQTDKFKNLTPEEIETIYTMAFQDGCALAVHWLLNFERSHEISPAVLGNALIELCRRTGNCDNCDGWREDHHCETLKFLISSGKIKNVPADLIQVACNSVRDVPMMGYIFAEYLSEQRQDAQGRKAAM